MSMKTKFLRLAVGIAIVTLILFVAFSLIPSAILTWGATPEETASIWPGDEILPEPNLMWTHGITIHAPLEETWPWIIQIGDTRGGFYSYTFIENLFAGKDLYHNADRIVIEWQNPKQGETIIDVMLAIKDYQPDAWMLAESTEALNEIGLRWTWGWNLSAIDAQNTRMVIRMRIQGDMITNPLATFFVNVGGFVMEQNMIQGIKLRAEGRSEPSYIEVVEIVIWLATLLVGLTAAALFITRKEWIAPLLIGIASVLLLVVLTFVQPVIWLRIILVSGLLAALWRAFKGRGK
jgi:hypothetical protein